MEVQIDLTKKSIAWHYFGILKDKETNKIIDDSKKYCDICVKNGQKFGYKASVATTSLLAHLRDDHEIDVKKNRSEPETPITEYFSRKESSSQEGRSNIAIKSIAKKNNEEEKLMNVCLKGFVPLSLFVNPELRSYLGELTKISQFSVDINKFEKSILLKKYTETKIKLLAEIKKDSLGINICFYQWSHKNVKKFIETTGFYVNEEWELKQFSLPLLKLDFTTEESGVTGALKENLSDFGLSKDNIISITSNLKHEVDGDFSDFREGCVLSKLQKLFFDFCSNGIIIKELEKMLKIFRLFTYSDIKADESVDDEILYILRQKGDQIDAMDDVFTMYEAECQPYIFNYNMQKDLIDCYVQNKSGIMSFLLSLDEEQLLFSKKEYCILEDVLAVSKIFADIQEILFFQGFPSMSLTLFVKEELLQRLRKLSEGKLSKHSYTAAENLIEKIEAEFKLSELIITSMISDPITVRSKNLHDHFMNGEEDMIGFVQDRIPVVNNQNSCHVEKEDGSSFFDSLIRRHTSMDIIEKTHLNFEEYKLVNLKGSTKFEWWKNNFSRFEALSKLTRRFLSVPATATEAIVGAQKNIDDLLQKTKFSSNQIKFTEFIYKNYGLYKN